MRGAHPDHLSVSERLPYSDWKPALQACSVAFPTPPKTIYYPGCSTDITPSEVFPHARILYLEKDGGDVEALSAHGYEAIQGDVTHYHPGIPIDLTLMINLPGGLEQAMDHIDSEYILTNHFDLATSYGLGGTASMCDVIVEEYSHRYGLVGIVDYPRTTPRFTSIPDPDFTTIGFSPWVQKSGHDLGGLFLFKRRTVGEIHS